MSFKPSPIPGDTYEASANAGREMRAAIDSLARSAAYEERLAATPGEGDTGAAAVQWALVRMLCHDTGHDLDSITRSARNRAQCFI